MHTYLPQLKRLMCSNDSNTAHTQITGNRSHTIAQLYALSQTHTNLTGLGSDCEQRAQKPPVRVLSTAANDKLPVPMPMSSSQHPRAPCTTISISGSDTYAHARRGKYTRRCRHCH